MPYARSHETFFVELPDVTVPRREDDRGSGRWDIHVCDCLEELQLQQLVDALFAIADAARGTRRCQNAPQFAGGALPLDVPGSDESVVI
jgi:hypothetical protein